MMEHGCTVLHTFESVVAMPGWHSLTTEGREAVLAPAQFPASFAGVKLCHPA